MTGPRVSLVPVAVGLFGAGLLAILLIFLLYAIGISDLPLWLNLTTLLAPLGFVVGVGGAIRNTRRAAEGHLRSPG